MFSMTTAEVLRPPARVVLNFRAADRAFLAKQTRVLWPYDQHCVDEADMCLEVALLGPLLAVADDGVVARLAAVLKAASRLLPTRKLQFRGVFERKVWGHQRNRFVAEFAPHAGLSSWVRKLQRDVCALKFPVVPRVCSRHRAKFLLPHPLFAHVSSGWGPNQPDWELREVREFEVVSLGVVGPASERVTKHFCCTPRQ